MTKEQFFGMYIGQKSTKGTICGVDNKGIFADHRSTIDTYHMFIDDNLKLILRPFSSMTDEEVGYLKSNFLIPPENLHLKELIFTFSKQIEYLISIGIDVFNGKDRGWAVYESEVGK